MGGHGVAEGVTGAVQPSREDAAVGVNGELTGWGDVTTARHYGTSGGLPMLCSITVESKAWHVYIAALPDKANAARTFLQSVTSP